MMWLADTAVHTTGINWESVAVIASSIVIVMAGVTGWFARQITHAIGDLSTKLELKLESKEVVNAINLRLTVIETTVKDALQKDKNA
jgi:hypothetical protein